ncbi:MAG: UPF0182 family membrane protein [Gemmatimonadales bacterium]
MTSTQGPSVRRRFAFLAVIIVLILGVSIPGLSSFLVDWWWFREIGFEVVFTRQLVTKLSLFLAVGTITFGLVYLNLRIAQRGIVPDPVLLQFQPASRRVDLTGALRRISFPAALALGLLTGLGVTPAWSLVLQAIHGSSFGLADPVFGRDVGFYVFSLPAWSVALGLLTSLTTLILLLVTPIYWIRGDLILGQRQLRIEPSAGLHLGILIAANLLLAAVRHWLVDASGLLYSTTGPLVGASYTDLNATLPALRVSSAVALVAAVGVLFGAVRGKLAWYGLWSVGSYLVISFAGRSLVPWAMQKFIVAPTELTREAPQLVSHITATRNAWNLDSVEVRDLTGESELTNETIRANAATIDNVRLWDGEPLLRTLGQLQEIRTYYDFVSVDDDRYWIDGKYRQVLLAPRELNPGALPTRTFINEHLTFTHGMGVTMSPVNQVTTQGLPVLFIQDLPPKSSVSLEVSRPQIYYGEMADRYVFVNTAQREFDHPAGEANIFRAYTGTGGITIDNALRRLLFSIHYGSTKILLSGDITAESRILYRRNIVERAREALPFLSLDGDPYLVIGTDGTLKWVLDAYTTTDRYPYAARFGPAGINYMRNSVKVVIDAYDGSIGAYVSDPKDPVITTWAAIMPGIFKPLDQLPAGLLDHLRYPEDLYRAQTSLYTTYHMTEPEGFYNREDQWQIPVVAKSDGSVPFMRRIVMRLPDEPTAEFIYMVPFTPRGKDNLAAWMVARSDGDDYGKLRVYRLPRQSLVFGPQQIENRINQDTEIARQISLWDQRGTRVIRGDLLVIPIEEALLYVQPLYLQADGGRIPELKRVVVAYRNQVVMEETLEGGLAVLFGGGTDAPRQPAATEATDQPPAPASAAVASPAFQQLSAEARRRYQAALDAQRAGDWARYGEEIRRLGELLEQLAQAGVPRD